MQRSECKDYMSLIAIDKWTPLAHVQLLTQDAQDLSFCPNGSCLCVWDSLDYNIFMHALDGSCLASYRAYSEPALGIRAACWSPSGQLLALGGFDNVRPPLQHRLLPTCHGVAACPLSFSGSPWPPEYFYQMLNAHSTRRHVGWHRLCGCLGAPGIP